MWTGVWRQRSAKNFLLYTFHRKLYNRLALTNIRQLLCSTTAFTLCSLPCGWFKTFLFATARFSSVSTLSVGEDD